MSNTTAKKLILHVGPYKTGSTSIQRNIFKNRNIIKNECNVHYFEYNFDHGPSIRNAFHEKPETLHNNIVEGKTLEKIELESRQVLKAIEEEIENSKCDTFLLSGEHISDLSEKSLERLKEHFSRKFSEFLIVYYLRDPKSLILSDLQEAVKTGRAVIGEWKFDYILPRYHAKIKELCRVFGSDNVTLLRFEDAVRSETGFVQYFINSIFSTPIELDEELKANSSISNVGFNLLERLNAVCPSVKNGVRNPERNINYVRFLKEAKGSKLSLEVPFDKTFSDKINRELSKLERDFGVSYPHYKYTSEHLDAVTLGNSDLSSFSHYLNQQFNHIDDEKNDSADLLRDAALKLESEDLDFAIKLMEQAKRLRPKGPFIDKKLKEFKAKK